MNVLVTGGAGYIGSFVVRALRARGHAPVVVDDLSRGHEWALDGAPFHRGPCGDADAIADLMTRHGVEAVVHLAGLSLVGESVREPDRYWSANVGQSAGLIEACRRAGVRRFVLSSSAAVYGEPEHVPIVEEHPLRPTNPYGATKVAIEELLGAARATDGLGWVSLRYFNAAGAMPDGSLGELHEPETHLVPLALAAARGDGPPLTVFGRDWPTPDGTCLRDYVHVLDLAEAHVLALGWMEAHPGEALIANLGGGRGTSVLEVMAAVEKAAGCGVPHRFGERRAGDPAVLVAAIEKARRELGWEPRRSGIGGIVRDAWGWESRGDASKRDE